MNKFHNSKSCIRHTEWGKTKDNNAQIHWQTLISTLHFSKIYKLHPQTKYNPKIINIALYYKIIIIDWSLNTKCENPFQPADIVVCLKQFPEKLWKAVNGCHWRKFTTVAGSAFVEKVMYWHIRLFYGRRRTVSSCVQVCSLLIETVVNVRGEIGKRLESGEKGLKTDYFGIIYCLVPLLL